ncbi:MAG: transcription termination/antitermination protein NusG [bacterium]|nr:transcription termination/antitermination protein NusG [bacterium]
MDENKGVIDEFEDTSESSLMETISVDEESTDEVTDSSDDTAAQVAEPIAENAIEIAAEKSSEEIDNQEPVKNESDESEESDASSDDDEENDGRRWYTLQCYSLQEHKVRDRILLMMNDVVQGKVFRVLLPEEETVEIKNNKRMERTTKIYPGYIFVCMLPDQEAWFLLKQIPGVAKIVGDKKAPTAISPKEIDKILRKVGDKTKKIEVDFELNEMIKVISGPFRGYSGTISEINADRGKLKSLISIFGRETPVELDFDQVEKALGT